MNLISEDDPKMGADPEKLEKAVWSCIQEKPTKFMGYTLYDPGAWPEPPICQKISMRITEPWRPEISDEEAKIIEHMKTAASKRGKKETLIEEEAKERSRRENQKLT